MRGPRRLTLGLLTLLALSPALLAYVESFDDVVPQLTRHISRWEGLKAVGERRLAGADGALAAPVKTTLHVHYPRLMRLETAGQPTAIHDRRPDAAFLALPEATRIFLELYAALGGEATLRERLADWRVPLEHSRLARLDGQIALVFGREPWSDEAPQLWLDKWSRAPLRLIVHTSEGRRVRLELRGWDSPLMDQRCPRTAALYDNDRLVERWEFLAIERVQEPGALYSSLAEH